MRYYIRSHYSRVDIRVILIIIWYIDTIISLFLPLTSLLYRGKIVKRVPRGCNDPKWKMWGCRYGGIFLHAFSVEGTCRQRDHESGKDGPIVGRISQFRNHRPEPVTNRSYRPGPGSFRQQREDEHTGMFMAWKINRPLARYPLCSLLSPPPLSFGLTSPRRAPLIVALNLPLQIYRPIALKRHPLVTYTRVCNL